jgi:hypothetical protein
MTIAADSLPTDLTAAHAMILETRAALVMAEARASAAESEAKHRALLIEKLKYTIAKLRHEKFGQSSERAAILEQLELQLAELQEDASAAETTAQLTAAGAKMGAQLRATDAGAPAIARASAARAHHLSGSHGVSVLRRGSAQDRRGHDRDP